MKQSISEQINELSLISRGANRKINQPANQSANQSPNQKTD